MNGNEIFDYLTKAGLEPHQAAGVLGNWKQESNLNPTAVNPNSGAYGLAQWLGPRKRALGEFARTRGTGTEDARTQLDFFLNEITGNERNAGLALLASKTPEEAALAVSRKYERAGKDESRDDKRMMNSRKLFEQMMNKYGGRVLNTIVPAAQASEGVDLDELARRIEAEPDEQPQAPQASQNMDLDALAAKIEAEPDESTLSPEVQTGIRSTTRALSSPASFLIDAANAPYNLVARGVNAIKPNTMDYLPMGKDYVDYGLQSMGVNPEAQSMPERAVTAGLSAVSGGGLANLAKLKATDGLANQAAEYFGSGLGRQAASAATSSLAGDTAREAGVGEWGELAARVAGGMGGSAAMGIAEGVGRGTGRALNTLSESGQEKAAGRILARGTTAPNQAIERLENPELRREFQAGNRPWSVEITQDAGQIAQMRALENSDIGKKAMVGNMRDVRKSESDAAVTDALNRLGGRHGGGGRGDPITQIAELKRDAVRGFRGEKDLSLMQADGTLPGRQIIALREEHQGDSAIMRYLNGIERRIGGGPISFQELWNARKEVDNQLYKVWKDAAPESKKVLAGAGKQLRTAMNAALLEADPTFAPFLRRYSRLSAAEDRLRLGRELGDSLKNSGRRMVTNSADAVGDAAVSAAKAGRLESKLYDVADELTPMGERLTKGQRGILESVFREKERNAWLDKTDTQSATAPYLAEGKMIAEDIANAALGTRPGEGAGVIRSLTELVGGRPVDLALRHLEPAIGKKLARAYQNPEYMAKLLRLANDRQAPTLRGIAGNLGRTGSLAEFYGMLGR